MECVYPCWISEYHTKSFAISQQTLKVGYGATVFNSTSVCLPGDSIPNPSQVFLHAQMRNRLRFLLGGQVLGEKHPFLEIPERIGLVGGRTHVTMCCQLLCQTPNIFSPLTVVFDGVLLFQQSRTGSNAMHEGGCEKVFPSKFVLTSSNEFCENK